MATISNYSWRIYGDGGPENPECKMVAYRTNPEHDPQQWQETLEGRDKSEAMIIVIQDKWAAEQIPDGEGYKQSTINEGQRWYLRTSKQTGNSWECILDEDGEEVENPCSFLSDPRDRKFAFTHGTGSLEYKGQKAKLTLEWTETPPTA